MTAPKPWSEMTRDELMAARQEAGRAVDVLNRELTRVSTRPGPKWHIEELKAPIRARLEVQLAALREIKERHRAVCEAEEMGKRRAVQVLADLVVALDGTDLPERARQLVAEARRFPEISRHADLMVKVI